MTKSAKIKDILVNCAKDERTMPYSELAPKVDMDRRDLDVLLDSVCDWSKKKCEVLLSVLVVRKGANGRPGIGFFKKHKNPDDGRDNETFFREECERVFQAAKDGKLDSL